MAAAPPLFALLLVVLLPAALTLSPYDDLVQQGARLNSTNFILRDPPYGDWLSWQHVGEVPPADPAISTMCESGLVLDASYVSGHCTSRHSRNDVFSSPLVDMQYTCFAFLVFTHVF